MFLSTVKMSGKAVISASIKAVKSTRKLAPTKAAITLTPAAIERCKELISKIFTLFNSFRFAFNQI